MQKSPVFMFMVTVKSQLESLSFVPEKMAPPPGLLTIRSEGIYHGLPTLPDTASGLTAIVTGANGISGTYMVSKRSSAALPLPSSTLLR